MNDFQNHIKYRGLEAPLKSIQEKLTQLEEKFVRRSGESLVENIVGEQNDLMIEDTDERAATIVNDSEQQEEQSFNFPIDPTSPANDVLSAQSSQVAK